MFGAGQLPTPSSSGSGQSYFDPEQHPQGRGRAAAPSVVNSVRPRRKSPPSMYVAYETHVAKPPKPLLKLDKTKKKEQEKGKERAQTVVESPVPSPVGSGPRGKRARAATLAADSGPSPDQDGTRRGLMKRPSIASFLSLRKKTTGSISIPNPFSTASSSHPPPPLAVVTTFPERPALKRSATASSSGSGSIPQFHLPRPPLPVPPMPYGTPPNIQQTHVHPGADFSTDDLLYQDDDDEEIQEVPRNFNPNAPPRTSKAARLLGNDPAPSSQRYPKYRIPDAPYYISDSPASSVSSLASSSAPFSSRRRRVGTGDSQATFVDGDAGMFYTEEGGWYADDAHYPAKPAGVEMDAWDDGADHVGQTRRDSMMISPIEFKRSSMSVFPPGAAQPDSDAESPLDGRDRDVGSQGDEEEEVDSVPPTPIAPLGPRPRRPRTAPNAHRPPRVDSHIHHAYAFTHLRQHEDGYRRDSAFSQAEAMAAARPDTPFMDVLIARGGAPASAVANRAISPSGDRHARSPSAALSFTTRSETGWQGEWNSGDMGEVMNKLRTLR